MIQRFIELGEGYSDLYELEAILQSQRDRVQHLLLFKTSINDKEKLSVGLILKPTRTGDFQPIYFCREGISFNENQKTKRHEMIEDWALEIGKTPHILEVKPSHTFHEKELYFQHLIGILRMNRYLTGM